MDKILQAQDLKTIFSNSIGYDASSDFDLNKEFYPADRNLRDAAVLIPLQFKNGSWHIILTKRSAQLKHHPGQISFPGGKVENSDASSLSAALRESHEEIGLSTDLVEVIGQLPTHETVTSFLVTPHVGIVPPDFEPIPEQGEVSEVFSVPLEHFKTEANFQIHHRRWNDLERRYYSVPYGPYYIWGATARMMLLFHQILGEFDANKC